MAAAVGGAGFGFGGGGADRAHSAGARPSPESGSSSERDRACAAARPHRRARSAGPTFGPDGVPSGRAGPAWVAERDRGQARGPCSRCALRTVTFVIASPSRSLGVASTRRRCPGGWVLAELLGRVDAAHVGDATSTRAPASGVRPRWCNAIVVVAQRQQHRLPSRLDATLRSGRRRLLVRRARRFAPGQRAAAGAAPCAVAPAAATPMTRRGQCSSRRSSPEAGSRGRAGKIGGGYPRAPAAVSGIRIYRPIPVGAPIAGYWRAAKGEHGVQDRGLRADREHATPARWCRAAGRSTGCARRVSIRTPASRRWSATTSTAAGRCVPAVHVRETRQRYRDDTLILETEFVCDGGAVRIIDFMPPCGESLRRRPHHRGRRRRSAGGDAARRPLRLRRRHAAGSR